MKDVSTNPRAEDPSTEAIWAAFADPLRRFIRTRVDNEADAEDILQTVFIKIHTRLSQLKTADTLTSWIYQIARNAIIDHFRARAATPASVVVPEDLPDDAEPPAVIGELEGCVRPMIDHLPEQYRHALTETACAGCSCGCEEAGIMCRAWTYQGRRYDAPPKELIVDAIRRAVAAPRDERVGTDVPTREVPDNLRRFFAAQRRTAPAIPGGTPCC